MVFLLPGMKGQSNEKEKVGKTEGHERNIITKNECI
jgi:hypothetical protein